MIVHAEPVGPLATNCYLIGCPDTGDALLLDPGGDAKRIIRAIKNLGLEVTAMAATHAHIDHVAAAAELQQILGLPLHLHQAEVPLLNIVPQQARWFGFDHADVPADLRLLAEGDELRVGSLLFLIRETPGHSPGGLTFVAGGSAFVGDAVFAGSIGRADLPGGSSAQLLDSIRRQILTLPSDTRLYPGHGPATTVRREATSNPFLL